MDYKKLLFERNKSNNDFGTDLGVKILEIGEGYAYGEFPIKKEHKNLIGTIHAGVLFTFADVVAGSATMAYGSYATTINSVINYLNPAPVDTKKLIGKSRVVRNGRTIMVVDVEITDENETLIATSTFTLYRIKKMITLFDEE